MNSLQAPAARRGVLLAAFACAAPACSGGAPAPATRGTPALAAAMVTPATAPDTSWTLHRYPRWGISLPGPGDGWTIVGPPDARCGTTTDTLLDERGRAFPWDSVAGADLRIRFVRPPEDSALALEGFERSSEWPSGWAGLGRQGMPAEAAVTRRARWWALTAEVVVGVPLDGGGMGLGEEPRALAVVPRPDGCRLIVVLGDTLLDHSGDALLTARASRILDSVRFEGEDGRP